MNQLCKIRTFNKEDESEEEAAESLVHLKFHETLTSLKIS